jgi:hypothetical protein
MVAQFASLTTVFGSTDPMYGSLGSLTSFHSEQQYILLGTNSLTFIDGGVAIEHNGVVAR